MTELIQVVNMSERVSLENLSPYTQICWKNQAGTSALVKIANNMTLAHVGTNKIYLDIEQPPITNYYEYVERLLNDGHNVYVFSTVEELLEFAKEEI